MHLATLTLRDNSSIFEAVRVIAGICPEEIVGGEYVHSPMPSPLEIALRVKHTEAVKIMATLYLRHIKN